MKRLTTLIAAVLLFAVSVAAQDPKRPRFNPEEFRAKMESYIAQKACLSDAEAEKVFPIFREMKAKQFEVMRQSQKLSKKGDGPDNDKECQETLLKMMSLNVKSAQIEETYYKKMCKTISAKKVYRLKMADDAFHREMLRGFGGGHNRRPHGANESRKKQ